MPVCYITKGGVMKTVFKWVGIGFIVLIAIGLVASGDKAGSGAAPEAAAPREVVSVNAADLFKEYEANEVAADERLKGKIVQVSGTVQAIDKDAFDKINVKLRTANEFMPMHLSMKDSEKAAAIVLKKGVKVLARCEKISRIIGSPIGSDCTFVKGS